MSTEEYSRVFTQNYLKQFDNPNDFTNNINFINNLNPEECSKIEELMKSIQPLQSNLHQASAIQSTPPLSNFKSDSSTTDKGSKKRKTYLSGEIDKELPQTIIDISVPKKQKLKHKLEEHHHSVKELCCKVQEIAKKYIKNKNQISWTQISNDYNRGRPEPEQYESVRLSTILRHHKICILKSYDCPAPNCVFIPFKDRLYIPREEVLSEIKKIAKNFEKRPGAHPIPWDLLAKAFNKDRDERQHHTGNSLRTLLKTNIGGVLKCLKESTRKIKNPDQAIRNKAKQNLKKQFKQSSKRKAKQSSKLSFKQSKTLTAIQSSFISTLSTESFSVPTPLVSTIDQLSSIPSTSLTPASSFSFLSSSLVTSSSSSSSTSSSSSSTHSSLSTSSSSSTFSTSSTSLTSTLPFESVLENGQINIDKLFNKVIRIAEKIGLDLRGHFSWKAVANIYNDEKITPINEQLSSEDLKDKLAYLIRYYLKTANLPKNPHLTTLLKNPSTEIPNFNRKSSIDLLQNKIKKIAQDMYLSPKGAIPWVELGKKYNATLGVDDEKITSTVLKKKLQYRVSIIKESFKNYKEVCKNNPTELDKICEIAKTIPKKNRLIPWDVILERYNETLHRSQVYLSLKEFKAKFRGHTTKINEYLGTNLKL